MVLPSGETSVSSLSKGNLSSAASEFDSLTQTGYAGLGNGGLANSSSVFKQTDVGSTDPRLVRNNVAARSKDEFQCNETLNNFSAERLVGRSRDAGAEYAGEFRGNGQENKSYSLAGRFARACLLHDTGPSRAGCDLFQGGYEMPKKASRDKTRCWSNYSDGQDSCLSAQSGPDTPNDGSRSGSTTTDCNDIFLDVSDMSLSVEEPPVPLPSEPDSEAHSPITSRDPETQNSQENDNLRCDAVGVKETTTKDPCLVRKTPEDVGGDFDIYNIETTLPYMNWDYLEEQLQRAIKREEMSQSQRNDREKIRQKLAMGLDEEHFAAGDRLFKKPSLQSRLHSAMNLQMCFVNEASSDVAENASDAEQVEERKNCKGLSPRELSSSLLLHSLSTSSSLASSKNSLQSAAMATAAMATAAPPAVNSASQEDLDFFTRQARLQAEARLALAQVRPMAHMQLQLEKQTRRKSPIADIVGIPGFGDGKHGHLSRQLLQRMNFGQLQVVVNDMHTQIEAFNSELMELLIDRDDLHMAQDSMLVDIEDLTRRAQEYEMRIKSKLTGSQNSC